MAEEVVVSDGVSGGKGAKVFVPYETSALAQGAEEVARNLVKEAATRGIDIDLVRTGSRGAHWLEPLVEIEVAGKRIAYGPVGGADVAALFDSGFLTGAAHPLQVGSPDELDWFKGQDRQSLKRCGVVDPLSLKDFEASGGFTGLKRALAMAPQEIVDVIQASGLRGRGGAGFPAGIKWQTVLDQRSDEKFVVCNADEGDSGTFSDRVLMEGDPFTLMEGMAIAAYATGASHGFVYLRSEYPVTEKVLTRALETAREAGWLGKNIAGTGFDFDITLRIGAGSYVCGEETALLESLEGKRGQVRAKPPLPAVQGLFGAPTLVNNVITLASVPEILCQGAEAYAAKGMGRSKGTLPVQLAGNVKRGGVVEVPFGITLRELVEGYGGGTRSGRPIRALQIGGPLGAYLPSSALDLPLDYEALAEAGGLLGHGGIVVFDDTVDMGAQARFAMEFCALESCGKCTPCRIGSVRGVEVIDDILKGGLTESNQALLEDLLETMEDGSLCAMGGLTPLPVKSALRHFPEDFRKRQDAAE
ncbi:MAG: NADH-quinone oxidoreductase subunit NuoF [Alphaproteobacteria bacterium]|nr:MAG: NADH-quinone oxidoreductase subunit NuoF [Alphaproteobacteria bacterium]